MGEYSDTYFVYIRGYVIHFINFVFFLCKIGDKRNFRLKFTLGKKLCVKKEYKKKTDKQI